MENRKVILDCDTGVDDAIAIICALGAKELDILGITSVGGNVKEKYTSQNNLDLVTYLEKDVRVFHGASRPIVDKSMDASEVHGKKGLGDIKLETSSRSFEDMIASDFIYEQALLFKKKLEIVVTGPMTNIALSIIKHPDICKYVKHIYFMAGAINGGNVYKNNEFNAYFDPEALNIVLNSNIPLTMVGLDVTNRAILDEEDMDYIRSFDGKANELTANILDFMINRRNQDVRGARMHDGLALLSMIRPDCLKFKKYFVACELEGKYSRGHTFVDTRNSLNNKKNCRVAYDIDVDKFKKYMFELIRGVK